MQQHAVPQNITGFEFKLIGFLTIKQFGYLAVPGIFSFIFFLSPFPSIVKIIFITPAALLGVAMAFVPVNGVPFDKWIIIFLRSVYSPSRRVWHKTPKEISFLSPSFSNYLKRPKIVSKPISSDRSRLNNYLAGLKGKKGQSGLDLFEQGRLSKLNFSTTVPHFSESALNDVSNEGIEPFKEISQDQPTNTEFNSLEKQSEEVTNG